LANFQLDFLTPSLAALISSVRKLGAIRVWYLLLEILFRVPHCGLGIKTRAFLANMLKQIIKFAHSFSLSLWFLKFKCTRFLFLFYRRKNRRIFVIFSSFLSSLFTKTTNPGDFLLLISVKHAFTRVLVNNLSKN